MPQRTLNTSFPLFQVEVFTTEVRRIKKIFRRGVDCEKVFNPNQYSILSAHCMGGLFDAFVSYKPTTREDMILPHPQLFLDNDELNAGLYEGEVISQQGIKAT